MEDQDLAKIVIDLPNHWAGVGGESMWARPVGDDLFEIRNIPFYAYGLNYLDVVRATAPSAGALPAIKEVVKRSGHETLRLTFFDNTEVPARHELLDTLKPDHVSWEGANDSYYALDLESEAPYDKIRSQLDAWEREGLISYETCEQQQSGSFDARPEQAG